MDLFKPIFEAISNRFPVKLEIGATGVDPKFFYVQITNQTVAIPVFVRQVRIHFGNKSSSCALRLEPYEDVKVSPKERVQFLLKYTENIVSRHYLSLTPPSPREDDTGPGFDSPANLFNAIGRGAAADSWIEIDFNEFDRRVFFNGKVQPMIDAIGCYIRDLREMKATKKGVI